MGSVSWQKNATHKKSFTSQAQYRTPLLTLQHRQHRGTPSKAKTGASSKNTCNTILPYCILPHYRTHRYRQEKNETLSHQPYFRRSPAAPASYASARVASCEGRTGQPRTLSSRLLAWSYSTRHHRAFEPVADFRESQAGCTAVPFAQNFGTTKATTVILFFVMCDKKHDSSRTN